jgi:hypothetical protein
LCPGSTKEGHLIHPDEGREVVKKSRHGKNDLREPKEVDGQFSRQKK